jgi:prolyl oligopeptidase
MRGTDVKNNVYIANLADPEVKNFDKKIYFKPLIEDWSGAYNYVQNFGTKFFFDTNYKAAKGRIISIDIARPDSEYWNEVLPETKDVADANHLYNNNTLAVRYLAEGAHILKVYRLPAENSK